MSIAADASCAIAFAHRRFNYRGGALHSERDEPAAKLAAFPLEHTKDARMYSIDVAPTGDYKMSYAPVQSAYTERLHWYCGGDLHRDYGPAVYIYHSRLRDAEDCSWYKYHRGVQMASDWNTCMGELNEFCPRLLAYCDASCRCANNRCARVIAAGPMKHYFFESIDRGYYDDTRAYVYQTCTGTIVQCQRAGAVNQCPKSKYSSDKCTCYKIVEVGRYRSGCMMRTAVIIE
jgi:hypothetical protein